MRLPGLSLLSVAAVFGAARAQIPADLIGIDVDGVAQKSAYYDQGKLDPAANSDFTTSLHFSVEGKQISGSNVGDICPNNVRGEGRILYSLSGGPTSSGGHCRLSDGKHTWEADYQWSAQAQVSGGRLVLTGNGTMTKRTVRGCNGCPPEKIEVAEQATIQIDGGTCQLVSYSEKRTKNTAHPYFKTPETWIYTTVPTPSSSCSVIKP